MAAPRIDQTEFAGRRQRLMEALPINSAVIVPSANLQSRNSDVEWPFRQDSDFYYLSGFDEPDALIVLLKNGSQVRYHLFCQPRDPEMEIWNGYRSGPSGARTHYHADQAWSSEEIDERLPQLLDGIETLFFCMGGPYDTEIRIDAWLKTMRRKRRQGVRAPYRQEDLSPRLHEMRLFKSPQEIAVMSHAAEVSAQAHIKAMKLCRPGLFEYQLEAEIIHHFMQNGCRLPAYSSIVGGGENACVLHYVSNRHELKQGDLVLIDAGCEWDYYAGDITRTFPVSGKFSDDQKALYELVLKAQLACLDAIRPGLLWEESHDLSVRIITEGLVALGILEGNVGELIEQGAYKAFYMHRLGHWLGMDVHDVGDYKVANEWRPLEAGMVMTVEPGIYIAADNQNVEPRWRGIGIRIEDDVLITEDGNKVLTASVPKTIAEIEALMAEGAQ
ncbi:Xaa-Pro aminopeptidase [Neptunomonas concharum]|uniref:Xaa-Pro aminopeptidase n=1 Tax=Neptunomonas concharum TaxID=1031538 RepID=A0A5P1RFY4_9GAMM|nr:Xaa-Pro aminopeptidase [Neptunomonas concharum]QEQ98092.1 Xaa-Pro aminopeptidase [Neptunomonas concharum]